MTTDSINAELAEHEQEAYSKALPTDKQSELIAAATALVDAGINTPEEIVSVLTKRFEGKHNAYSQSIWYIIQAFDRTNSIERIPPDWNALFAAQHEEDDLELTVFQRISRSERLATSWARKMFPLPEEEYEARLLKAREILTSLGFERRSIGSYLRALPLLLEHQAIASYISRTEQLHLLNEYPNLITPNEAAQLMAMDRMFSSEETETLEQMLDPTSSKGKSAIRVWELINEMA